MSDTYTMPCYCDTTYNTDLLLCVCVWSVGGFFCFCFCLIETKLYNENCLLLACFVNNDDNDDDDDDDDRYYIDR